MVCYGMSYSSVIFTNYDTKIKILLGMDFRLYNLIYAYGYIYHIVILILIYYMF